MDRSTVTSGIDGFAVARDVRRSRPIGIVADLATYTAGHYKDAPPLSIELEVPIPFVRRGFSSPPCPPAA
jgi:hypothetical protein